MKMESISNRTDLIDPELKNLELLPGILMCIRYKSGFDKKY